MASEQQIIDKIRQLADAGIAKQELLNYLTQAGLPEKKAAELYLKAFPGAGGSSEEKPKSYFAFPDVSDTKERDTIWEKGIMAAVNSKLDQMEKMRDSLDLLMQKKLDDLSSRNDKKIEALFSTQKDLIVAKFEARVDKKMSDISSLIDTKISELKRLNLSANEELQQISSQKQEASGLIGQVKTTIQGVNELKKDLASEMEKDLNDFESRSESLLQGTQIKMKTAEERSTKALELQAKIVEGLANSLEGEVDKLISKHFDELKAGYNLQIEEMIQEIEKHVKELHEFVKQKTGEASDSAKTVALEAEQKMGELNALTQQLNLDEITKAIHGLEELRTELTDLTEKKVDELQTKAVMRIDLLVKGKEKEFTATVDALSSDLKILKKDLTQKTAEVDSVKEGLNLFKDQFIKVVDKNVETFTSSMKTFNSKEAERGREFEGKIKELDQKMEQLEKFSETISEKLGVAVDRMKTQVAEKKSKK